MTLAKTPTFNSVLDAYKISSDNYWQPVDMAVALGGSTVNYSDPSLRLKKLQEKQFGLHSLNIERWQEKFFQFFRSYQHYTCYEARLLLVTIG